MMIVSANQPYFAPFPGFFVKALKSHVLVLMDGVQFPRGSTWLTRNRFKNDQGTFWLRVPVWRKGLGLQKINEVRICHERRWAARSLQALKSAYGHAPYFDDHLDFLEKTFSEPYERLIDLNLRIIRYLLGYMKIPVKVRLMSDLQVEEKEPRLSAEICRRLEGTHFMAPAGAARYLDPETFRAGGCELTFFRYRPLIYPQLWGEFIPNLSVFDLLFTCGPETQRVFEKSEYDGRAAEDVH